MGDHPHDSGQYDPAGHLAVSFIDRDGTPHEREIGALLRPQSWKAVRPGETVAIHWHRADDEIALTADLHAHTHHEMTWFALGLGAVGLLSGGGCWVLARRQRQRKVAERADASRRPPIGHLEKPTALLRDVIP